MHQLENFHGLNIRDSHPPPRRFIETRHLYSPGGVKYKTGDKQVPLLGHWNYCLAHIPHSHSNVLKYTIVGMDGLTQ